VKKKDAISFTERLEKWAETATLPRTTKRWGKVFRALGTHPLDKKQDQENTRKSNDK